MPKKIKSKEDLDGKSLAIREESQFVEGKSEWLKNDLLYLVRSPLDVQLRTILGTKTAESFLNPTIKDKKKVRLDGRFQIPKKPGSIDAHGLWNTLRTYSNNKLTKEEQKYCNESRSYGNRHLSENKELRKIQFSRHRTELMHRISQMNRSKTKEFLNDFFLPSFDEDFSDLVPTRTEVIPPPILTLQIPSIESLERLEVKHSTNIASSQRSSIRFVSEQDCRCDGKFRDRMEEIGVTMKTGISMGDIKLNNSSVHSVKENARSRSNVILKSENPSRVITSSMHAAVNTRDSRDILDTRDREFWEPLTMAALVQNKTECNFRWIVDG